MTSENYNPIMQIENRLRWFEYERDMIKEEGTSQELFLINRKIIKLHREKIMFRKLIVD